ncbi:hypothetical protein NC651_028081 [Populus alba x Populus x berolinensis]|nr:hypothetical protein NC651_028081 [Populus alba x Populus x berolinensis]
MLESLTRFLKGICKKYCAPNIALLGYGDKNISLLAKMEKDHNKTAAGLSVATRRETHVNQLLLLEYSFEQETLKREIEAQILSPSFLSFLSTVELSRVAKHGHSESRLVATNRRPRCVELGQNYHIHPRLAKKRTSIEGHSPTLNGDASPQGAGGPSPAAGETEVSSVAWVRLPSSPMYLGVLLVREAFVPSLYRTGWNSFVYLPAIPTVTYLPSGLAGCSVRP